MTTQTLTVQQLAALPRVNLLPPEIAQRRRARAIQVGMGAAVAAAVAVVGVVYLSAQSKANDAQSDLEAAQATQTQLRAQEARFAGDQSLRAELTSLRDMRTEAMSSEIRWSHFMADLSLRIPDNVWITSLLMAQTAPSTGNSTLNPSVLTDAGLGKVTVEGVALSHDDVAAWLDSLAKQKGYANPYFSKSEEDFIGGQKVANFSSSNTLTDDALSGRYTQPAGS